DWSNVCKWISYVEGSVEQPAMMEARARKKMRAVLEVDVQKEPVVQDVYYKSPTCNQIPEQFDVVATIFCLQSSGETAEQYARAVKSAVSLIKPGGFLLQAEVPHISEYSTGHRRFGCRYVTEDEVLQCLKAAQLIIIAAMENVFQSTYIESKFRSEVGLGVLVQWPVGQSYPLLQS
ncbi:hypothetical protein FO519_010097, partial [Halicephalobus sp. NKZ332]